jgi:phosphate uptake regulator
LSPKTEVDVQALQDGSLKIDTLGASDALEKTKEIVISVKDPDAGFLIRKALAAYIANYDIIRLDLSRVSLEAGGKEKIRRTIKNKMAGGEIVEESIHQITIQILLRPAEFPLEKLLIRMATMALDMAMDVSGGMRSGNRDVFLDVISRDEDVDKLYFMASRWLTNMLDDPSALQGYGMKDASDCLEYRMACRNIERVADHVCRMAEKYLPVIEQVPKEIAKKYAEAIESSGSVFIRSVNCLQSGSLQEANKAIHDSRRVLTHIEGLMEALVNSDLSISAISNLVVVVGSMRRIAEYGIGISELVFNLYTE